MRGNSGIKKRTITEESVLHAIAAPRERLSAEEARREAQQDAQHDADTTTAAEYDEWFFQALCERENQIIRPGYGGIQHPTSRLFEIGVDSIRAGKPSELFLTLLAEIGEMAEERDVMAALFPDTFMGRIKTTSVRSAQRDADTVAKFKKHVRKYLGSPKTPKTTGSEDKGGSWTRVERTYAEAIADYKRGMNPDEKKALDRALQKQGDAIIEWRDQIASTCKSE